MTRWVSRESQGAHTGVKPKRWGVYCELVPGYITLFEKRSEAERHAVISNEGADPLVFLLLDRRTGHFYNPDTGKAIHLPPARRSR